MKNKILDYRAGIVAGLLFFLAAAGACADDDDIAPAFQGHWTGNARIIVTWCRQTNLSLALDIHSDGTVAGKVGDARLKSGRFERNRGWLGRALHLKTDYVIHGRLQGPIVAAEGITRPHVSIPMNAGNGIFTGGLATSGTTFGGKKSMILTAGDLKLTRSH